MKKLLELNIVLFQTVLLAVFFVGAAEAHNDIPQAPPVQVVPPVAAPALANPSAPKSLVNDTLPDSPERALLNALAAKNIYVLTDKQYSPRNIVSLREYMQFLIGRGFDAAAVNAFPNKRVTQIAFASHVRAAEAYFYDEEIGKKTVFREATLSSSQLFALLTNVIAGASNELAGGDAESIRNFAINFKNHLDVLRKRCNNLGVISRSYFAHRAGLSKNALEESIARIGGLIDAIRVFMLDIVRRAKDDDNRAMTLFHAMYEHMDAAGLCDDFFEAGSYDDFSPATQLNDNTTLRQRYEVWRNANNLGAIPQPERI